MHHSPLSIADFGSRFPWVQIWEIIDARRAGGTARPPWGKICPEEMHGIRKEKEVEAIVRSGITIEKTTEAVT